MSEGPSQPLSLMWMLIQNQPSLFLPSLLSLLLRLSRYGGLLLAVALLSLTHPD